MADAFTRVLKDYALTISMDGQVRCIDNVFVERLWPSVTYAVLYLRAYETPTVVRRAGGARLEKYFRFYDSRCCYIVLNRRTAATMYFGQAALTVVA